MPRGKEFHIKPLLIRSVKITPGTQPLCAAHEWTLEQGQKGQEYGACRVCGATIALGPVVWAQKGEAGGRLRAVEG